MRGRLVVGKGCGELTVGVPGVGDQVVEGAVASEQQAADLF
jgi:hypothetical protein